MNFSIVYREGEKFMYQNNLKRTMREKNVSGFELFRRTNIAPSTISGIVNNRVIPFPGWRKRISEALDVPETEIFPENNEGKESVV